MVPSRDVSRIVSVVVFLVVWVVGGVCGHGRLWEPPSRSSMWRRGYNTTVNIDDNELSCGGFMNHWILNSGRCGVCGDPYQQHPRANENGGKYASGLIPRTYPVGAIMEVVIGLTANHRGSFEFRLCPLHDTKTTESQACMDQYKLKILNTVTGETRSRYVINDHMLEGEVRVSVMLPPGLRCTHCVIQWKYRTGTRWGCDANDVCGQGVGPQEEFYGCSDIAVADVPNTIYFLPRQSKHQDRIGLNDLGSAHQRNITPTSEHDISPDIKYIAHKGDTAIRGSTDPRIGQSKANTPMINHIHDTNYMENLVLQSIRAYYNSNKGIDFGRSELCTAVPRYRKNPIINEWCRKTCPKHRGICPPSICSCESVYRHRGTVQIPDGKTFTDNQQLRSFAKNLINKSQMHNITTTGRKHTPPVGEDWLLATLPVPRDFFQSPKVSLIKTELLRVAGASPNDVYKHGSTTRRARLPTSFGDHLATNRRHLPKLGGVHSIQTETPKKHSGVKNKTIPNDQNPGLKCTASVRFSHNRSMVNWCTTNCLFGFCPKSVCTCSK